MSKHLPEATENNPARTTVTICDLPVEILDYIFGYLTVKERLQTELVCRSWRKIGKTISWRYPTKLDVLDLTDECENGTPTDNILSSVLSRCGRNLKQLAVTLSVEDSFSFSSKVLTLIGQSCPNLLNVRLNFAEMEVYDPGFSRNLVNLAKGCPELKQVRIGFSDYLNDGALVPFLKLCPSLECLVLGRNDRITETFINALNKKLKCFYVYSCSHLSHTVVAKKLMSRCDRIEGFGLLDDCDSDLDVHTLVKLLKHYRNTLKTLYLDKYEADLDEWRLIPNVLQNLEYLSLTYCDVDDDLVDRLVKHCKFLKGLNVAYTQVTDDGISALAAAPLLTILDMSGLSITGEGIQRLASEGRLEKLYMHSIKLDESFLEDHSVDMLHLEESCLLLASLCPNLRTLDVNENAFITNRLVDEFCSSIERGFLKYPVNLYVAYTKVSANTKSCAKLNLSFNDEYVVEDFNHLAISFRNI